MKTYMKLGALSLVASLALVGCGSSSSSQDSDGVETGYFMDSAVLGVEYETSSGNKGITGENGSFRYQNGETVEFKLGKLSLGHAEPTTDGLVTPKMLISGDAVPTTEQEEQITLLLRTLQSLDSDNDPTNGITITQDQLDSLGTLPEEITFSELDEDGLIALENQHNLGLDEDYDGHIDVDDTSANAHFRSTMDDWDHGERPDDVGSDSEHGKGVQDGSDDGAQKRKGRDGETGSSTDHEGEASSSFVLEDYPVTATMTQDLKDALAYMGNEERLAYDVYANLYNYQLKEKMVDIKQLTNIATKSEVTHVGIVQSLVQRYNLSATDLTDVETPVAENNTSFEDMPSGKYDIASIQNLYDALYALGQTDTESALKVGCMVEVTDINDLDEYITLAQESNATDVEAAFELLRDGSYNHYWAFDKGLKNLGVESGCYYEGDALLGEDKTDIYPQNEH